MVCTWHINNGRRDASDREKGHAQSFHDIQKAHWLKSGEKINATIHTDLLREIYLQKASENNHFHHAYCFDATCIGTHQVSYLYQPRIVGRVTLHTSKWHNDINWCCYCLVISTMITNKIFTSSEADFPHSPDHKPFMSPSLRTTRGEMAANQPESLPKRMVIATRHTRSCHLLPSMTLNTLSKKSRI